MYYLKLLIIFCYIFHVNSEVTFKIGAIFGYNQHHQVKTFKFAIEEHNSLLDEDDNHLEAVVQYIDLEKPFQAMTATCALIEEGVVAILGPTSEHCFKIVQSVCDNKDIPLLVWKPVDDSYKSVVNLYPHQETLTRSYFDIIEAWGFENFAILYESNESLRRIGKLIEYFYTRKNKVIAAELDQYNIGIYRPVLKDMLKSGVTNFVIDCNIDILDEVLRQVQQVSLMSDKYKFIITNLDLHTLDLIQYQFSGANITGIRFVNPEQATLQKLSTEYFKTDGDPFGLQGWKVRLETLLIRDTVLLLGEILREMPSKLIPPQITCDSFEVWSLGSTVTNLLHSKRFIGGSGVIRFDTANQRSNFTLEVIELLEGGIVKVGDWNNLNGLSIKRIQSSTENINNKSLQDEKFRILITILPPFAVYKDTLDILSGNERFEGYSIDLIKELSDMEGFNYTFIVQEDNENGKLENGKWIGMLGNIYYGNADLAIGDLTITKERQEHFDFAAPFMTLGISILYHKATKTSPGFFSFADPFALEVWELLAVAFLGVSLLFYILGRICSDEWANPYPCIEEPEYLINQLSLRNCFWFTAASLMQQGSEIGPVAISTRMVAAVWWFFVLIMVSSYTANLAAFLTKETPQPHFNNIQELVANQHKHNIKWGAKARGSTAGFFEKKKDSNEVYGKIYNYMKEHENETMIFGKPEEGVARAERENYAFFMEITQIEYEIQRRCNLTAVGDLLDEKSYGIAMKKNSTYRNVFSRAILKLEQTGKLADLKRRWWEERRGGGLCSKDDEGAEATALGWKNVSGVFGVTIGGTIAACVMVFIELILHVFKVSIKTKTSWRYTLTEELKFYFNFSGMVKPVIKPASSQDTVNED